VGEDGGLIAGHARVLAARQLGIAEIPVMVAAGWTEAQKRAYVLADNQLELKEIMADRTGGLTDPDDVPAAPEHPVSQTGDLWLLGRHRLLCGDSTVATDVERVLGGRNETAKRRPHIPVPRPLLAALRRAHGRASSPYVIAYQGRRLASVKRAFNAAAARAGIPDCTSHTLRHTAGT
jgi:hypothetical protein